MEEKCKFSQGGLWPFYALSSPAAEELQKARTSLHENILERGSENESVQGCTSSQLEKVKIERLFQSKRRAVKAEVRTLKVWREMVTLMI